MSARLPLGVAPHDSAPAANCWWPAAAAAACSSREGEEGSTLVFKRERPSPVRRTAAHTAPAATPNPAGRAAEVRAERWLVGQGLVPVARNYRVARGPSARGGEVDLILRDRDGTLVFVEVRARADARHGGAAASIGAAKRQRVVFAAQHYLLRLPAPPPCRFDVVAVEGEEVHWIPAAFDAD
ncbi:MAG: YraN family protein [Rubrivivax sp.]|nr:YraN family protein [Rubrivivax sp.]